MVCHRRVQGCETPAEYYLSASNGILEHNVHACPAHFKEAGQKLKDQIDFFDRIGERKFGRITPKKI